MTIQAKYTLTEAHFIIVELEKKLIEIQLELEHLENYMKAREWHLDPQDSHAGNIGMP